MVLMNAVLDDTMAVPGFEHHTFRCSECQDIERRLVFTKHSEGDTEPMPVEIAPTIAPSTAQDEHLAPSVITECYTEPTPVEAALSIAPASTGQDEHVAFSGILGRVVAKIRHLGTVQH